VKGAGGFDLPNDDAGTGMGMLQVTPFLPGDSLLFACGTLSAMGSLNIYFVFPLLFVAAVLGDTVNYAMGERASLQPVLY
jgi:membrane protein DedA with SNARE-associated domain